MTLIAPARAFDLLDHGAFANVDAFAANVLEDHRGQFGIVLAERLEAFEHGHLAAEAAVRLRHLHADRSATDDDEVVDLFLVVEQRLVGEVGHVGEAGDRRHQRCGAGRDHEPARLDQAVTGLHRRFVDEPPGGLDDVNAEAGEALDGVVRLDGADHAFDVVVDLGVVDRRLGAARFRTRRSCA